MSLRTAGHRLSLENTINGLLWLLAPLAICGDHHRHARLAQLLALGVVLWMLAFRCVSRTDIRVRSDEGSWIERCTTVESNASRAPIVWSTFVRILPFRSSRYASRSSISSLQVLLIRKCRLRLIHYFSSQTRLICKKGDKEDKTYVERKTFWKCDTNP